jgi:hypothetical protein
MNNIIIACNFVGQQLSGVIHPPNSIHTEGIPCPEAFLLPAVILWNPMLSHSNALPTTGLSCLKCKRPCRMAYWNDGSSEHTQPRLIHDVEDAVLLVSAVYLCDEGHKTLAHNPTVLDMLPSKLIVPFILVHKTGFTLNFVNLCVSLCQSGMNFHSLEGVIGHRRWEYFESRKKLYQCSIQLSLVDDSNGHPFPSFLDYHKKYLPSDDTISQCFLKKFLEEENAYISEIQSLSPGESLSFDHTFKLASNIGYIRSDKKWVCQYDSAFLVCNENGKIVSWQFTKGTSFQNVRTLLENIVKRCHTHGCTVKTVYVDNCCQWRNKIREVFGSNVTVLLDLFHAVQRITRKIPKRHPFYGACVEQLRLVFRSSGDCGIERTKPTPSPTQLLQNVDSFISQWKDVSHENRFVLTKECLEEFEKLKVHIMKGCLSQIPPGGGTNRNEAFHRYVNTFFHKSRLGILLAYALMMMIIHQSNSKGFGRKNLYKPISTAKTIDSNHLERMGIMESTTNEDSTWMQEQTHTEDSIDPSEIESTILISLTQFNVHKSMRAQTKTATQLWKYIPFTQLLPLIYIRNSVLSDPAEVREHNQRLQNNASSWGFHLIPVPKDGNCFFFSVALSLLQNTNNHPILNKLGVDINDSVVHLSLKLREVIVQEWLGPNRSEYESFLTSESTYEDDAKQFLQLHHYNTDLGNTMPLAMANAIGVSFIILTSMASSPVFIVSPRAGTSADHVLYLAFTSVGSLQHYDGLVLKSTPQESAVPVDMTKCRCGVNSKNKENQVACTHSNGRHSSCRCLAKGRGCTPSCSCKGCQNPNGKRQKGDTKRTREPHEWQKFDTSTNFVTHKAGQTLQQGRWSEFESIVFVNLVRYMERNLMYSENKDSNVSILTNLFSSVVEYINSPYCSIQLPVDAVMRHKSQQQVTGKFTNYHIEKSLFNQMFQ